VVNYKTATLNYKATREKIQDGRCSVDSEAGTNNRILILQSRKNITIDVIKILFVAIFNSIN
jgi:hypothetical protein